MTLLAVEHGVRCPRYCHVNPRETQIDPDDERLDTIRTGGSLISIWELSPRMGLRPCRFSGGRRLSRFEYYRPLPESAGTRGRSSENYLTLCELSAFCLRQT